MDNVSDEDTMHEASARGDLEAVQHFVEVEGLDVDAKDGHGDTPLIIAALNSHDNGPSSIPDVIRYLVLQHADVEAVLQRSHFLGGCTALMIASRFGHLKAVQVLLEQGRADVNHTQMWTKGHTALVHATRTTNGLRVVPTLLQHGAKVNFSIIAVSCSPLVLACVLACCKQDVSEIVQQLLEHGANVTREFGTQALECAAKYGDAATVRLLLAHPQMTVDHRNLINSTITEDRSPERHSQVMSVLLDLGRDRMTEMEFHKLLMNALPSLSPLHYLYSVGLAKVLIEQPRRRNQLLPACREQLVQKDCYGRTPLDAAKFREQMLTLHVYTDLLVYLDSFETLALSIPVAASTNPAPCDDQDSYAIGVKLNPSLNSFQQDVAEEALNLVVDTMSELPESTAHAVLGYLCSLDVMKRRKNY